MNFDVSEAPLTTIKLMLGSSFSLNYGHLYTIRPPTQMMLGFEYKLRFAWPRPPQTSSSSHGAHEEPRNADESFWLGGTSDYDADRVDLKSVRDNFGFPILLSGFICIELSAWDPNRTDQRAADVEETSEIYLVLWGLKQHDAKSAPHFQVKSHREAYQESAWCCVVA